MYLVIMAFYFIKKKKSKNKKTPYLPYLFFSNMLP